MVGVNPARLILGECDGGLGARLGRRTVGEVGLDPPAAAGRRRRSLGQEAAIGAAQRARRIPVASLQKLLLREGWRLGVRRDCPAGS